MEGGGGVAPVDRCPLVVSTVSDRRFAWAWACARVLCVLVEGALLLRGLDLYAYLIGGMLMLAVGGPPPPLEWAMEGPPSVPRSVRRCCNLSTSEFRSLISCERLLPGELGFASATFTFTLLPLTLPVPIPPAPGPCLGPAPAPAPTRALTPAPAPALSNIFCGIFCI